jgi:hypothetical protein
MKEETIEGWVKVHETFDFMDAELIEARLQDESIEFQVLNKADIGYTMDVGNNELGRQALGLPMKFFVKPEDVEAATEIIKEDRSSLLDDPNLNFDDIGFEEIEEDDDTDEENQ